MKLKNYTDLDNEMIRAVIRAVRPPGIANFSVTIKNAKHHGSGRMYHSNKITVKVPKTEKLARHYRNNGGAYLPCWLGSRMEVFLKILAHELRHLWQRKVKRGWRVWGARGQYSERDADAYALQMLRRFRRGELDLTLTSDDGTVGVVKTTESARKAA